MKTAPLVIVAFNRPELLRNTIELLSRNDLASSTDLFVYVDGPRPGREDDLSRTAAVADVANHACGFSSVTVRTSAHNKGLAASVTGAASEVLAEYGTVIVVEDDLATAPGFLRYMNTMLDRFRDDRRVMQVSAYGCDLGRGCSYPWDVYLNRRAHSWSWATWQDRWETVDWEVRDFDSLSASIPARMRFNRYGSDLFGMLKGWKTGRNNSWYIRFDYSMHRQGRFCVCPVRSLVRNDGFGMDATNCKAYNRYRIDDSGWNDMEWKVPDTLEWDSALNRRAVRFWSIPWRIYGKIRNTVQKWI